MPAYACQEVYLRGKFSYLRPRRINPVWYPTLEQAREAAAWIALHTFADRVYVVQSNFNGRIIRRIEEIPVRRAVRSRG